jgi:hypothetical protein
MRTRWLVSTALAVVCAVAATAAPAAAEADITAPLAFSFTPNTVTPLPLGAYAGYYRQNAVVIADYECRDETGGSGVASCVGTVPDGAPLDTTTLGVHAFQIVAQDNAGNTSTLSFSYLVADPATVSISSATVVENDSGRQAVKLAVTMTNGAVPVSVSYSTHARSADSSDYLTRRGTLSFWRTRTTRAGTSLVWKTAQTIVVPLLPDTTPEGDQVFTVDLVPLWPATTPVDIVDGTGTVTILNDDLTAGQRVSVSDVTAREGSALYFVVSLANPAATAITVPFTVAGDTATGGPKSAPGSDFVTKKPGTLTFSAGQRFKYVAVTGLADKTAEADETLHVMLGTPTGGAALHRPTGTGTIFDDDA